jgi:tRNA pseudouridine38-40 synthase
MARYKLILAYDGTGFAGSQKQANARTVQGDLEKALRGLGWSGASILLAGRTDAGVHAAGQVAAFDLEWRHSELDLVHALNAALPGDLAVRSAEAVGENFHPRFDARARIYRYRMFCQPVRDPLRERYAWRAWPDVDGQALIQNASIFTGRHDFSGYGSPTSPNGHTERTVERSEWRRAEDEWRYEVQADAFLYRMVRRLVFVQAAIAQGRVRAEAAAHSLASPAEGREAGELPAGLAPSNGLSLVEIDYG